MTEWMGASLDKHESMNNAGRFTVTTTPSKSHFFRAAAAERVDDFLGDNKCLQLYSTVLE